jgi:site-specific DNA recombinase
VLARKSPSLRPANRSTWKRSDADSKQRRWQLNDDAQLVTHHEERLRIVPQALWDAVKARQQSVEGMTVKLRGAVRHKGVLPRHVLSGLLVCQVCGGTIRRVNGREYGCATHKDGGDAACSNGIRVREEIAERKLLDELACEMLSPEGVALVKQRVNEHVRKASRAPKSPPKPQAALIERKRAEIAQLRTLMTAGTLSQAVAQAAVEKAQEEIQSLERMQPAREEKHTARVIRMLPRAADILRNRIRGGNLGLRDPRSIIPARNVLFEMFGGRVSLRPAVVKPGTKPYLVARIALNRNVLLQAAASAAGCWIGSGGTLR